MDIDKALQGGNVSYKLENNCMNIRIEFIKERNASQGQAEFKLPIARPGSPSHDTDYRWREPNTESRTGYERRRKQTKDLREYRKMKMVNFGFNLINWVYFTV